MTAVLLVGCPESYRRALPRSADPVQAQDWSSVPKGMPEPAMVVIGPFADHPVLVVRRATQTYHGIELMIAVPSTALPSLRQELETAPYLPPGTQLVTSDDAAEVCNTIQRTFARIRLRRQDDHVVVSTYKSLAAALVESAHDAILTVTLDGRITDWNPAAERLYGLPAEQAVGQSIDIVVPEERRTEIREILDRLKMGQSVRNLETVHTNSDLRRIDVSLTASPLEEATGAVIGASIVSRDIADVKRAQAALRDSEARKAAIFDAALDAIITIDHQGLVVEWNAAAESIFGRTAAEVRGLSLADLIIPVRYREAHRLGLARYLETGEGPALGARLELSALGPGGEEFPVELSIVRLAGTDPPLFTGFLRDLTQLRRAQQELDRLVADLKRSNAELEQFAYIASHDLQEPLRMVASYTQLLEERYRGKLDEKADQYIRYATDGAKRMQQLVNDLLAYSRVDTQGRPLQPIDSATVLVDIVDRMQAAIADSGADVTWKELPRVKADEMQLGQLFQNLIGNALKFRAARQPQVHIAAQREGGEWCFSVSDNGIGIDKEQAGRIFEMFQRLHERGKYDGSGIGLAIAKRIAERHGGRIWFESEPGIGSTFFFTIPSV